jgi:hypothetical protein
MALDSLRLISDIHPPTIGHHFLALDPASKTCDLEYPVLNIDLGDRAHFDTEPIQVTVNMPPIGSPLRSRWHSMIHNVFHFWLALHLTAYSRNPCHPTLDAIFIY